MLQINNKIQSEKDYKVFDDNSGEFITNELNRDYQVHELSKRLARVIEETINYEINIQVNLQNNNNVQLLTTLQDIAKHAAEIDF